MHSEEINTGPLDDLRGAAGFSGMGSSGGSGGTGDGGKGRGSNVRLSHIPASPPVSTAQLKDLNDMPAQARPVVADPDTAALLREAGVCAREGDLQEGVAGACFAYGG